MSLGACEQEESDLDVGDSPGPSLGMQAASVSDIPISSLAPRKLCPVAVTASLADTATHTQKLDIINKW